MPSAPLVMASQTSALLYAEVDHKAALVGLGYISARCSL